MHLVALHNRYQWAIFWGPAVVAPAPAQGPGPDLNRPAEAAARRQAGREALLEAQRNAEKLLASLNGHLAAVDRGGEALLSEDTVDGVNTLIMSANLRQAHGQRR